MSAQKLIGMSLAELADAYASRSLSPVEVVNEVITHAEAVNAPPAWRRQNGDCGFNRDVSRSPARKEPKAVPECGHFDCSFAHSYVRSFEIWDRSSRPASGAV